MEAIFGILIGIGLIIFIVFLDYIYNKQFPHTDKFRIKEKYVGEFIYYRPEVYRSFFGWTSFYASKYYGTILQNLSWSPDKEESEKQIKLYKQLKPIKLI